MNLIAAPPKGKLCSLHKAANAAFHAKAQATIDAAAAGQQDFIHISVESEESDIITDNGEGFKFFALAQATMRTTGKEVSIKGPERDTKAEAIKDSDVLNRAFDLEGVEGVKRVAQRLERKVWTRGELLSNVENSMEGLLVDPHAKTGTKVDKLIPPGEGWVRHSDEMLWDPRSEVYFVQTGKRMGQYLMRDKKTSEFQEVDTPHKGCEFPATSRAAGASLVRKGAKLERTVLLNGLPKIARVALKFPLSFVDTPANAFALFQGLRSAEAADWCAKNFHTKLIPMLASKIHNWETRELEDVLARVLREMDAELLKGPNAFSGCNAAVALLLGDRLIVAGVGQARFVVLFDDGSSRQLLSGTCDFRAGAERERVEKACGNGQSGVLTRSAEGLDEAQRILLSRHPFEVLQLDEGGPSDDKQVRTAYRRLALKVHPDKRSEAIDTEAYNKAFALLEVAKEAVETTLAADGEACRELHRILRADVHTREGAGELLCVDKAASFDTEQVTEEAEQSRKKLEKKLAKLEHVCATEYKQALASLKEAVETIRRPSSAEALPRQEAVLKMGLSTSRAMGVRDLRYPEPVVLMVPESTSWHVPTVGKGCRLAMLCGATAALPSQRLLSVASRFKNHPKAAAMKWCADADSSASSVGAVCICFEGAKREGDTASGPAAKRQKAASGQLAGTIFLRHILFRHKQLRGNDPAARRIGAAGSPLEAEAAALAALEKVMAQPATFPKLCRELSDCHTAEQAGQLCGHLGWVGRGELEAALEEAAFACQPNEFGDVVTTSRGVHVIQRLG